MEHYFKIHDYSEKEKAQISILILNGQSLIWWGHILEVNGIKERKVDYEKFQKYFKDKYLSAWYHEIKRKKFHELKLGQKSMEEHVQKFMEMLTYVEYIRE